MTTRADASVATPCATWYAEGAYFECGPSPTPKRDISDRLIAAGVWPWPRDEDRHEGRDGASWPKLF
jgi:hypothetical protein